MPKKSPEKPKIEKIETKEEKASEELSDSEKVDLVTEIFTGQFLREDYSNKGTKVEEAYRGRFLKDIENNPEMIEGFKESKLTPEQLRFLKRCMVEINRRGRIVSLAQGIGKFTLEQRCFSTSYKTRPDPILETKIRDWNKVKELERLIKESEEASTDFVIPGSDADRKGELNFDLNQAKWWRNAFVSFTDDRVGIKWSKKRGEKLSEKDIEKLSRDEEGFREIDDAFKGWVEEFEREKSKAKVPEEELEETRKKTEEAFEEGGEKE